MSKVDPEKMYVTKEMLDEAVEAILEGVDKLVGGLRGEMNDRFDTVEGRFDKVGVELSHVKDTVRGLKVDLFDTPTRRGFEELKARGDKHHPQHAP